MFIYIVPFIIAIGVTFLITPLVARMALKWGAMDAPNARKVHTHTIPRLGGLAIFLGYIAGLIYCALWGHMHVGQEKLALFVGTCLIVGIGIWDDIVQIGPKTKLLGQIAAAAILAFNGVTIDFIHFFWGPMLFLPNWVAIPLTIFWVVAFTNIVNLIDGLDGLAAGISIIASAAIFFAAASLGQMDTALITVSLAGATYGFLRYNFNPASIFMGDTGSMLLGYTLGAISVYGVVKTTTMVVLIVPVIAMGVPIMDTAFAILRRYMNGKPIFKPDKSHIHHRLLAMGLSHKQAVLLLYGVTAFFGVLAVFVSSSNAYLGVAMIAVVLIVTVFFALRIGVLSKEKSL